MPSELRHLLFRPAEVLQAIVEYHRRLGHRLPPGAVLSCGPECEGPGKPVLFRITLAPDPVAGQAAAGPDGRPKQDVIIEGSTLAAALILYCRDRRIPMSAHADKSLECVGKQVCLVATMNPKQDEMPAVASMRL